MKKIGILSVSLVTNIANMITIIIPFMVIAYPNKSQTSVETLVTISSLSALIIILCNGKITKKFGFKKVVLSGLLIGIVFGIIPYFIQNYYLFLFSRIMLGIGVGLYSPHAISMISIFYKGKERTTLLGMQMGIGAFGNAILVLLTGWLATWGWKYTFFVYLFLGIIFVLVWKFVPNNHEQSIIDFKTVKAEKLNNMVKKYLLLCFLTFVIIFGVQLKIPSYLVERGISSPEKAGLTLGAMNIAGMLAGVTFGYFYKKATVFLLSIGFLGAGISVIGIIMSTSWITILAFAILFNFVYSLTGPTITLQVNQSSAENQLIKANSWITITTILASYAAPLVWNSLAKFSDKTNSSSLTMIPMIISLLIIGLLLGFYFSIKKYKLNYKS